MAVWDEKKKKLVNVGKVGTGFSDDELRDIKNKLDEGEKVYARIAYMKVGSQGRLRASSFQGLRDDITDKETHL